MNKMSYEQMVEMLGLRLDQIDHHYKHKFRCWRCRDQGVVPSSESSAIAWYVPKPNETITWKLCTWCDYHKKEVKV